MKTEGVVAGYTHVAVAVGVPVLQQAPGLGVYDSLKESMKDRDFNGIRCFLQVVETHKYIAILLHVPVDHFLCCENSICA
jgi:hypothetical protein